MFLIFYILMHRLPGRDDGIFQVDRYLVLCSVQGPQPTGTMFGPLQTIPAKLYTRAPGIVPSVLVQRQNAASLLLQLPAIVSRTVLIWHRDSKSSFDTLTMRKRQRVALSRVDSSSRVSRDSCLGPKAFNQGEAFLLLSRLKA